MDQREPRGEARLSVQDVSVSFGGIRALDGVSLDVSTGEVLGVIGPNGAGKTTRAIATRFWTAYGTRRNRCAPTIS